MDIKELIARDRELCRLLPLVGGITIIEYDGEYIQGSEALSGYLLDNGISTGIVDRIIVCGKPSSRLLYNYHRLETLYPFAKVEKTDSEWQKSDFEALHVHDVMVFHMAAATGITAGDYNSDQGKGALLRNIVCSTRNAYDACLLSSEVPFFDEAFDDCTIEKHVRLDDFRRNEEDQEPEPTDYCRDKMDQLAMFESALVAKDYFFQCMDEMVNGCEECNLCKNYGKGKRCPSAQRRIAQCYRQGVFVPKNEVVAHQWEVKAARQGYKSAHIQMADDLAEGFGCKQSKEAALSIYKTYARKGDRLCVDRVIKQALAGEGKEQLAAIPYIALSAKDGDEEMVLKLSDAFQNGSIGLPRDRVQQEEWIRQGAENGNPRFVKAMAEMYEANEEWAESYNWYKTLSELDSSLLLDGKLEEMELRMLTNGASDDEIAWKGMDYLYGWHGMERDTHLAYRYFHYAKDKGVALAEGLLGRMYYEGMGVIENMRRGADLMDAAAEKGDLMSMDKIIDICYNDVVYYDGDCKWDSEIEGVAEKEMTKGNPFAYYWKASNWLRCNMSQDDAFLFMKKAAEMDYPPAQYELAKLYGEGKGTEKDDNSYRQWLLKAADNGYCEAEGEYGVLLFESWRSADKGKAFPYLSKALEKGSDNERVGWSLAQCYMRGIGTAVDKRKAYPLYIRAAEEGNADAQEKLCQDYFNGNEGLEQNYKECARWGEEALKQGRRSVRFETAYSSSSIGKKDRAYELYLELANQGNIAAMNNLGCLERDDRKAFEWFLKAADKGSEVAQKNVARYFRFGIAVDKDEQKALEYYLKSAHQGYIESIKEVARMYRNGNCVEKNTQEAIVWYEKGISKGDEVSIMELAELCDKEIGDVERALHYYKLAVEKGNESAMIRIGEIYEQGVFVGRSLEKAIFWYRKAAAKNNEEAKNRLKRLGVNWLVDGKLEDGKSATDNVEDDLPF